MFEHEIQFDWSHNVSQKIQTFYTHTPFGLFLMEINAHDALCAFYPSSITDCAHLHAHHIYERSTIPVTACPHGSAFQHEVWRALTDIPYGTIVTYSDIARAIYRPNAARAVGTAIGKNRIVGYIPCHRVCPKNGAFTGFSYGVDLKRDLLLYEYHDLMRTDRFIPECHQKLADTLRIVKPQ